MYSFDNDDCLAVYRSDTFGDFLFTVREIRDDLWAWQISCGDKVTKSTMVGSVSFPLSGTCETRFECLGQAAILSYVDPNIWVAEFHDGASRQSITYGWVAEGEPCVLYGLGPVTIGRDGRRGSLSIKSILMWAEDR